MARYPKVQKRVQAEIDQEIGRSLPSSACRKQLQYTEAVLSEILRVSTVVQFLGRRVTKSTIIRGYLFPENAYVLSNFHAAHRDSRIWKDPEYFNVDNFYDEKTNSLINTNYLISFGMGMFMTYSP